ncbi:hypothetical protein [Actinoallomurus rhizosphaericola]|uniref:hypothetical protein n=1 Tax=Actinoallomurus rhizosphaericola TaxID=2952536 RepID=UPI002092186B|nr:hypothetical protein [Actinoallomurus rhizosphaericola]MCO6000010.1 hypothetical protein [Actinoallomurus rhizosphaericola]
MGGAYEIGGPLGSPIDGSVTSNAAPSRNVPSEDLFADIAAGRTDLAGGLRDGRAVASGDPDRLRRLGDLFVRPEPQDRHGPPAEHSKAVPRL